MAKMEDCLNSRECNIVRDFFGLLIKSNLRPNEVIKAIHSENSQGKPTRWTDGRFIQIERLIKQGKTFDEIGAMFGVAGKTVKNLRYMRQTQYKRQRSRCQ